MGSDKNHEQEQEQATDCRRDNNNNIPTGRLRLKLSSLRTTSSEIRSTEDNTPTSETKTNQSTPVYRNRTPSLTDIQKHLIKSNMIHLNSIKSSPTEPPATTTTQQQQQTTEQQQPKPTEQKQQPTEQKQQQPKQDPKDQQPNEKQQVTKDVHPLQHAWTLYFDSRTPKRSTASGASGGQLAYEAGLQTIGTFNTVEQFSRLFNWTVVPSQMETNSSVQLFKSHIKPMWEDPANAKGGKWTLTMKSNSNTSLLDRLWTYLVLGLVGEQIENDPTNNNHDDDDFICGAVVATRPRGNRIQIWVKEKDNVEKINSFGKRLMHVLELDDHSAVSVEFSAHHNSSGSQSRGGGGGGAHNTPLRPALGGGSIGMGGGIRGMEEKMMGGAAGPMMRRSTSAEVGQIGSGRINSGMGLHGNNFPSVGSGFLKVGLNGPPGSLSGRTSQLSSLDPPIQNGVWRPSSNHLSNNTPASDSIVRTAGLPGQPPSTMNQFNNQMVNRRHQSSQNLTTMGTLAGGNNNNTNHLSGIKSTASNKPSPLGGLPPGLQDSHHNRQSSSGSANAPPSTTINQQRPTDSASSRNPSRNPSPALPTTTTNPVGILSGS